MLRTVTRAAAPAVPAVGRAARPAVRKMATEAGNASAGAAQSGHFSVPQWGVAATTIGAGVGLFGVFANILHGDNVRTRTEMREDMKRLEDRMDKRFEGVDASLKEISAQLSTPKTKGWW